jgi:hypothetical protein
MLESRRKQTSFRCERKLLDDFQHKLIDSGRGMNGMSPMIEGWIRDYVSGNLPTLHGTREAHTHESPLPVSVLAVVRDVLTVLPVFRVTGFLRDLADATREAKNETDNPGNPKSGVAGY